MPRWYFIPLRVLLVTFLLTLLAFAISLLIGIIGTVILALFRGTAISMSNAYRHVAFPVALIAGAVGLVTMTFIEIRNYRQSKALSQIARSS